MDSKIYLVFLIVSCSLFQGTNTTSSKLGGDIRSKVIYAVNAGGGFQIVDSNNILYSPDPYMNTAVGIDSEYGLRFLTIGRTVNSNDALLYQTERYGLSTFGYNIPIKNDGDYVLVLKFCEVYFLNPGRKIFDVTLNTHLIIKDLDIFKKVGHHAVAHDEIIPFKVNMGNLLVNGQSSKIVKGVIRLDFVKGPRDNPKINAFYVLRGGIEDVPQLLPLDHYDDDDMNGYSENETGEDDIFREDNDQDFQEEDYVNNDGSTYASKHRSSRPPAPLSYDSYDDDDFWTSTVPLAITILVVLGTCIILKQTLGRGKAEN